MKSKSLIRGIPIAAIVAVAFLGGVMLASGFHMTAKAAAGPPPSPPPAIVSQPSHQFDFATLAERVVPSVVSVYSTDIVQPEELRREMPMNPFEFFFGPEFRQPMEQPNQPMVRRSAGSGFFIDSEGELLTNNHVIDDADKIQIQLNDGTTFDVEVVGRDPATDIAVLRVVKPDRDFPFLALGDSKALRVGEWVVAVGNPLNMDHTVTVGVVSATGRVLGLADNSFENFIQTDAAINFGNSGGPLVNDLGQVIGINTAINAGGQNLGFAVPINTATRILPQLQENGKVVRGYLGAQIRDISPDIQKAFKLDAHDGAFVEEVEAGHAADKAGLEHGDAIVSVNGELVKNPRELIDAVAMRPPGSKVTMGVIRDGKRLELKVKLEERPSSEQLRASASESSEDTTSARIGVTARELNPQLRQIYGIGDQISGVVITRVDPVSPAGEEGLLPGDVITEANGLSITTTQAFTQQVR
ncbi:MAG: Do family serine endopeptidase, partial [Thermoanaerobaculales bacterium]|nr:Do family serine endopeptidase [Thermoanaerobaculales bacterium]